MNGMTVYILNIFSAAHECQGKEINRKSLMGRDVNTGE
jgi:hypothetical protein